MTDKVELRFILVGGIPDLAGLKLDATTTIISTAEDACARLKRGDIVEYDFLGGAFNTKQSKPARVIKIKDITTVYNELMTFEIHLKPI